MFVIFQKFVIVLGEYNKCVNIINRFDSVESIEVTLQ